MTKRIGKLVGTIAALFWIAGCSELNLVSSYDPEIEAGLNSYHVEVLDFISTMETSRASLNGTYKGEKVSAYYAASNAALGNLVIQAEASDPEGTCGKARITGLGIAGLSQRTEELADDLGNALGSELALDGEEIARGSCTVITLRALQANHKSMQDLHRIEGRLVPPTSSITRDLLNDSVRIALTAEKAKK